MIQQVSRETGTSTTFMKLEKTTYNLLSCEPSTQSMSKWVFLMLNYQNTRVRIVVGTVDRTK